MSSGMEVPKGASKCPICGGLLVTVKLLEFNYNRDEPTVECPSGHFFWKNPDWTEKDKPEDFWVEASIRRIS